MARIHERPAAAVAALLARLGLSPNQLTLASVPPALAASVAAGAGWMLTSALFLAVSGVLDLLDGALARFTGRTTRFGALLDSSLDRVADGAVPIGLTVYFASRGWVAALPAAALLASLWVPYIRARTQSLGLELPRLWMRREDRFVVLFAGLAATALVGARLPDPDAPLILALAVIALLGGLAGLSALNAARRVDLTR